jgi:hypothetical protein
MEFMEGHTMSEIFRKFPSIASPEKYGYAFDSDAWQRGNDYAAEAKFRMFETYGDGLTQHSGDWAVTFDYLGDYLLSLSAYMMEHREDVELFQRVSYIALAGPRQKLIEFAAGLVWTEKDEPFGKSRYFSVTEQKITRNQDKRHDKRYQELTKYHDGSAKSIYNIVLTDREWADGMEKLCTAFAIKRYADDSMQNLWCDHPTELLGLWKEDPNAFQKRTTLAYGFRAIHALARSFQEWQSAECELSNYRNNTRIHAETAKAQENLALTDGNAA